MWQIGTQLINGIEHFYVFRINADVTVTYESKEEKYYHYYDAAKAAVDKLNKKNERR